MHDGFGVLAEYGYLVLFGFVFAEQVGLPIPAVPALLAAGALAGTGLINLPLALALATVASLLADLGWYALGRHRGSRVLALICQMSLEPDSCVRRTENLFARHGTRSLLIAKFVPGLSTVAPPLAGIFGVGVARFTLYAGAGALLWAGSWSGVGYLASDALEPVARHAERLGAWLVAAVVLAAVGYAALKFAQRRRVTRQLRIARIGPEELRQKLDAGEPLVVVDLRTALDVEADPSTIPGALRITAEELEARHREIPRDAEVVLYCT
ncbi:MAG TPA: VTT domain-containing protein [Candidatus Limnocylindria bacterium]|nr:VTT domain-containing protein [Candidatus Limnocylindria bacterium]